LSSGGEVLFFTSPHVPLFEVEVSFPRGSDKDPADHSGLAVLTANLMGKGAGGYDESGIARRLDDLAAVVEQAVGEDRTTFGTGGLNKSVDDVLGVFFAVLEAPAFNETTFNRTKKNLLSRVEQVADAPGALVSRVLALQLLNGSIKARPSTGFLKDLRSVVLDDLKGYYAELIQPAKARVLVIGGKDRSEILEPVLRRMEAWTQQRVVDFNAAVDHKFATWTPKVEVAFTPTPGVVTIVQRPGLREAHVQMGFLGPSRVVPEYSELEVAEAILSGPFRSRLNQAIREKRGLTYGIGGEFNYGNTMSTYVISATCSEEKTGRLLRETWKQLRLFRNGTSLNDEELSAAKSYLIGSFPLILHDRYNVAKMHFSAMLSGLPEGFLNTYRPGVSRVTVESLKAAVKKYFPAPPYTTVVVGDSAKIGPALKAAGIAYRVVEAESFL
jgi:zinc protease